METTGWILVADIPEGNEETLVCEGVAMTVSQLSGVTRELGLFRSAGSGQSIDDDRCQSQDRAGQDERASGGTAVH